MTKDLFAKLLTSKGVLQATDLTVSEKKDLCSFLQRYGISQALYYDRFFKEGFYEWEIEGINHIKSFFMDECLSDEKGNITESGKFYELIGNRRGLKSQFTKLMYDKGMRSEVTVRKRFASDDWKPWELMGICAIIEEFCKEYEAAL